MTQQIRRIAAATVLLVGAGLFATPAIANPFPQDAQQQQWGEQEAREFQGSGDFKNAARAWEMVVERDPSNGEAWHMLGYCIHMDGRIEEALAIHKVASEFDDYRGISLYNVGCAHALLGHTDAAFEALFASRRAGFNVAESAPGDSDLQSLRNDPRFEALLSSGPSQQQSRGQQVDRGSRADDLMAQIHGTVMQLQQFLEHQWPEVRQQIMMAMDEAAVQAQQALRMVQHELENNEQLQMVAQMVQQHLAGRRSATRPQRPDTRSAPPTAAAPPRPPVEVAEAVEVPTLQDAQQFQANGEWGHAVAAYEAILKQQPDNVAARFGHAYCLHMSGNYEAAIKAHKKAATYPQTRGIATYNLACAYALTGQKDKAIEALLKAREYGFQLNGQMQGDSDLDSLRDDPRYKALEREVEGGGAGDA